jgi:acyl carrier protein
MTTTAEPGILADVGRILSAMQGQGEPIEVGPETRFFADLGLASIDAVVLGERLQEHYGRPLPFAALLADLGRRADRDLSMGELAVFLARHLAD